MFGLSSLMKTEKAVPAESLGPTRLVIGETWQKSIE